MLLTKGSFQGSFQRPVVQGPCEMSTIATYSLEFSGGEAIFAESREKTAQNRLTNNELLSSF
jgi:hypothetical protein